MAKLVSAQKFAEFLYQQYKEGAGYIMGSYGQNPKNWSVNSWWFTQYSGTQKTKALYWREHSKRVFDCQGLAEGYYLDMTGVDVNTYARMNYSTWCSPKGSGTIPTKYRVPGAAVFWGGTAASIHHVGYLYKPVVANKPEGDWWIIEARGVMYGVVMTKMSERKPNFWGWMSKYFDYTSASSAAPTSTTTETRNLKNGSEGDDVKGIQEQLIELGYDLGRWGADGDFGDQTEIAVKKFQSDNNLTADGIVGEKTRSALDAAIAVLTKVVETPKQVEIVGGACYVRTKPNTSGAILGAVQAGTKLEYAGVTDDDTKWLKVKYKGQDGWVSYKYGRLAA